MNRSWAVFFLLGLFVLSPHASAALSLPTASELIQAADDSGLANHPIWLKLLHYDRRSESSEIISPDFFLSPRGGTDAGAELEATIRAYFQPWVDDYDQHPRCRFPARYFWLAQHLNFPGYAVRDARCKKLERWAMLDRMQSISVLLISGYFGNPASTFGHALIKFNTDSPDDEAGLFDLSLNFGALVPENEPTLLYIARGLSGGYQAGFSDKYFYTQDLVYARTELRDIWDYKLALPDKARTLLLLHVSEIVGKKYRYYFLTKNCAYRLAGLLELVTEEALVEGARVWYLPVELFHRLIDINARRLVADEPPLIKSVRFIPSNQRYLFHQFSRLAPSEVAAANDIIANQSHTIPIELMGIESERHASVLDSVLAYYQYRFVGEQPNPSVSLQEARNRAILNRLRLPVSQRPTDVPRALASPADATRPMRLGVGLGVDGNGHGYLLANGSPFVYESADTNDIASDELAVFDVSLGLDHDRAFLSRLDVVRVRKLNMMETEVAGESRLSWQARVAVQRVMEHDESRADGVVSYGLGRAWRWSRGFAGYAMTDIAGHTTSPNARLLPQLGLLRTDGSVRSIFQVGVENADNRRGWRTQWSARAQYLAAKNYTVRLDFGNETTTRLALSVSRHW